MSELNIRLTERDPEKLIIDPSLIHTDKSGLVVGYDLLVSNILTLEGTESAICLEGAAKMREAMKLPSYEESHLGDGR